MEFVKCVTHRSDFIVIVWFIGSTCNYKCSYCRDYFHDGKRPFRDDYSPFFRFVDKVKQKYPGKNICLSLFGGEVTYWKKIGDFLNDCKLNGVDARIVTNGSRSIEWWKENIDKIYSFILSYHNEYADEKHITEIMKLANQRSQVNLMMPPDKFDELIPIAERISENAKTCVFPRYLRVDMKTDLYPYTPEQIEFFKEKNFGIQYYKQGKYNYHGFTFYRSDGTTERFTNIRKVALNNLNRWKDWKCSGGINSFFIDYDYNVYVGQCKRGNFGNLLGDYELPNEWFICDKDICNCAQDILETNKEKVL